MQFTLPPFLTGVSGLVSLSATSPTCGIHVSEELVYHAQDIYIGSDLQFHDISIGCRVPEAPVVLFFRAVARPTNILNRLRVDVCNIAPVYLELEGEAGQTASLYNTDGGLIVGGMTAIGKEQTRALERQSLLAFADFEIGHMGMVPKYEKLYRKYGVHYVGEFLKMTEQDLLRLPGIGRKALREVKERLSLNGMCLGMLNLGEWQRPDGIGLILGKEPAQVMDRQSMLALADLEIGHLQMEPAHEKVYRDCGIRYIGELLQMTERDLLLLGKVGRKALREVKERLSLNGVCLGMLNSGEWQRPTV